MFCVWNFNVLFILQLLNCQLMIAQYLVPKFTYGMQAANPSGIEFSFQFNGMQQLPLE